MRQKVIFALGIIAAILLVRNLHQIFDVLPDEADQGAIYRIIFFHVPTAFTFMIGAFAAMVASVLFLARRNFAYDALAVSATEVALVCGAVTLTTGMIWARIIWGIWWAWDPRLTAMLISWLMYGAYLMLRRAVDEPTQRARFSAVFSIFSFPGVIITFKAIDWWRTQHPGPVLKFRTGEQRMDPGMEATLWWNVLAIVLVCIVLTLIRMRQESLQREVDGLRREAHAI